MVVRAPKPGTDPHEARASRAYPRPLLTVRLEQGEGQLGVEKEDRGVGAKDCIERRREEGLQVTQTWPYHLFAVDF